MVRFEVQNMTCGHCARAVTEALKGVDASASVEVDLPAKTVTVDSTVDAARLAEAVRDAGYDVRLLD